MGEDAVRIVVEDGEDPPRRWRPPDWLSIVVVLVLIGIGAVWAGVIPDSNGNGLGVASVACQDC